MAEVPPNRDELISQFVGLAGVSPQVVSSYVVIVTDVQR